MATLSDLPTEVLLNIFEAGCDDHSQLYNGSHSRKRYPFAALVRRVCQRWRNLIDFSSQPHFWVAQARIRYQSKDYVLHRNPLYLVSQLIEYRRVLLSSNGCDLMVQLEFQPFNSMLEDFDWSLSALEVIALQIITRAVLLLVAHREQVRRLEIRDQSQQSILSDDIIPLLLELQPLTRLVWFVIDLVRPDQVPSQEPHTIKKSLYPRSILKNESQNALIEHHFPSIDRFTISKDPFWLHNLQMSGLRHLRIDLPLDAQSEGTLTFLNALRKSNVGGSLVSLEISELDC